ncbi:MAG: dolichyl-phosphate beta-glucosyltransferase [Elusimicrobiota bacterium]
MKPEITLVIATYNEQQRLQKTYPQIRNYLKKHYERWELIIVDDGSTDATPALLERLKDADRDIRVIALTHNQGQGAALRTGVMAAHGVVIAYTDADLSTPLTHLADLQDALKRGAHIAIASRWIQGSHIRHKQPALRRYLGGAFYSLIRLFLPMGIADVNCGLKAYRDSAAKRIFALTHSRRWGFNTEHLLIAKRLGYQVTEVPVDWRHHGESKVRLFSDIVYTLWELASIYVRIRRNLRLKRKKPA